MMGRMRTAVTVLVVGALVGCAQVPQMTAVDLAANAERNMLEAQQKLAGRLVVVRGVVKETTLTSRDRIDVKGGQWGSYTATATASQEQVPLVILQPGSVLCYFEPANIGDAAPLREGDSVALECEVDSFRQMDQKALSMLAGCRRRK